MLRMREIKERLTRSENCPATLSSMAKDTYSVMQSNGNSFGGHVVLGSFNKTFRYENNILDQICKRKYVQIIFAMILILYNIIRKCILTQQ